jgi:hypothetical protein
MKHWITAILASLALGCATAIVRPYVGQQQAWPTAAGSIVNTRYGLPIFTTLPPSPYEVLAQLRISSPFYAQPEEGHLPVLVKKAIELGADALVFVEGRSFFSNNYGLPGTQPATPTGKPAAYTVTQVNRFLPDSFKPDVTIIAIRWVGEPPSGLPKSQFRIGLTEPEPTSTVVTTPPVEVPSTPATQAVENVVAPNSSAAPTNAAPVKETITPPPPPPPAPAPEPPAPAPATPAPAPEAPKPPPDVEAPPPPVVPVAPEPPPAPEPVVTDTNSVPAPPMPVP